MSRGKANIEDFLSYRLSILARHINRKSTRYFSERYNLTLAEWRCLTQIATHQAATIRSIADRTGSDKGQISRAAAALCKKNLLKRQSNELDGRSGIYTITKAGTDLYKKILPYRAAENKAVLDILSESEQEIFMELLNRIYEELKVAEDAQRRVFGENIPCDHGLCAYDLALRAQVEPRVGHGKLHKIAEALGHGARVRVSRFLVFCWR